MTRRLRTAALGLLAVVLVAGAAAAWHLHRLQPVRSGSLSLAGLTAPVEVRYDGLGIPQIEAQNEADLYRALGYLHAQDRLFQMEMVRRLARGELAEVVGEKALATDRLFRTLGIREHADSLAARMDTQAPATRALLAYLDGVNQYQASRPLPLEFSLLGIRPRPFTPADTFSVTGYLAWSFAAALRTEPALTELRDRLGPAYLALFDDAPAPLPAPQTGGPTARRPAVDHEALGRLAALAADAAGDLGLPVAEGSNAWVIAGRHTASGRPVLAGDPHIGYSVPSVWWEARLRAPGFELHGHHQALTPVALLGHNARFGWSLTMFQNDDLDLIAERVNPERPDQVWHQGRWVELEVREETIAVKGQPPVTLRLRRSPHGPLINEALDPVATAVGRAPVAMWWAWRESDNPLLEAFYRLNRADTLGAARTAVQGIHAPGLNVVWANAAGDIAWWAAARLPQRPAGVDARLILDGASGEADKPGWLPFSANPQSENPPQGWVVSANQRPADPAPPGYYNPPDRATRLATGLQARLAAGPHRLADSAALQLDTQALYPHAVLAPLRPALQALAERQTDAAARQRLQALLDWDGRHAPDDLGPTLFHQFLYDLARLALGDDTGEPLLRLLLRTRVIDTALPRLAADPASPWWDDRRTPAQETRESIVAAAWQAADAHLQQTFGPDPARWTWGRAHTLTHPHPLGRAAPLDRVFNVGPFPAPGARETPDNQAHTLGPAPWAVTYGPSTRRLLDLGAPGTALGGNPVGQSGVWGDAHYADQAADHIAGRHRPMPADSTGPALRLLPR